MILVRATLMFLVLATACRSADEFAEVDRKQCRRQLLLLRDALDHYRARHNDWPDALAELLPEYVTDRSLFDCPRAVRTGVRTRESVGRQRAAVGSYAYEFTLESVTAAGTKRAKREWKERQMSLVGDAVPALRCLSHETDRFLNAPVSGPIYESELYWEKRLTNAVLTLSGFEDEALFALESAVRTGLAPRDAKATAAQIDLAGFYNLRLDDPLIARLGLAPGFISTPEVQFDLRGAIQLRFVGTNGGLFPKNVIAIPINVRCRRLHFLHAIIEPIEPGALLAHYVIRDGRGQRHQFPITYGRDVVTAVPGPAPQGPTQTRVVDFAPDPNRASVRLCVSTWVNPSFDIAIASVDLRSAMTPAVPFVLAITSE